MKNTISPSGSMNRNTANAATFLREDVNQRKTGEHFKEEAAEFVAENRH